MPFRDLASFPNSRIKPRPATRESITGEVDIPAHEATIVRSSSEERTYLSIYNQSDKTSLRYVRGDNPVGIETNGFLLGADRGIDLEGPQALWVYSTEPITISFDDGIG